MSATPHDLDWPGLLDRHDAGIDQEIAKDEKAAAPQHLTPIDPLEIIRLALAHLQAADGQSIPSDDQIIVGHIRTAIALLKPVAYPERRS